MKLNHLSSFTGQGNQMVPLLPSKLRPLKSPRDNKIREVLKRYHTYHPVTSNLADLAKNKRQPKYDYVLSKLFIMTPQRALCVHLIR
jgi:hypothetical protein